MTTLECISVLVLIQHGFEVKSANKSMRKLTQYSYLGCGFLFPNAGNLLQETTRSSHGYIK